MQDFYKILQVRRGASQEEIKASFRRLVKKYHPDKNRSNQSWAVEKFKTVVKAYRTLTDTKRRLIYEKRFDEYNQQPFNYWEKLRKEAGDFFSQCRVMLHDLLNSNARRAVETYETLRAQNENFTIFTYLNPRDYLDCCFLLAEEYERQERFEQALELYEEVYREERLQSRFKYFLDEVRDRIRNIYCRQLARHAPPEEAITYYERLLSMELPKHEQAFIHKKVAECYYELGAHEMARAKLTEAFALKPNLQGALKICRKLEWERS